MVKLQHLIGIVGMACTLPFIWPSSFLKKEGSMTKIKVKTNLGLLQKGRDKE